MNPGNSGGRCSTLRDRWWNQLISATTSSSAGSIGLVCDSVGPAKRVASELIQSGEASMAYLGAYLSDATAEVADGSTPAPRLGGWSTALRQLRSTEVGT